MLEIQLDNGRILDLHGKSLLILHRGSIINKIINNEDDFNIILITGVTDRTFDIEVHQPVIIVVEACKRTTVKVTGGMGLLLSEAVFINGNGNKIKGLKKAKQNKGKILSAHREKFNLGEIADFSKIEIGT